MSLAGKSALVTGGGSGIGASAALRLAVEGCRLAIVDIRKGDAERIAALITARGGRAVAIAGDVSLEADNERFFDEAESALGGLDLAFLNAGAIQNYGPFDRMSIAEFDRMIAINLRGPYLGLRQAHRRLRLGGAAVVTASAAALTGFSDAAGYTAAKHGVVGLVRAAAREFASRGLRVNAICPGPVATPMIGAEQQDSVQDPSQLGTPAYRGELSPQMVAETALFLLSPAAAAINGQAQLVDAALLSAFPPAPEDQ
ncbi:MULTISPECIES: SDR family NAD(P)-dependent oxidoreductase [Sphingobium]|uniref:SDR family NAD(P)-dependent oxidoreductase n=1 Tax=Sphingobium tyrosinilyticum TaxID=2715436 RepID=A0ABV9F453_9SPHN|nr:SDR family oxidoreductase [Sphingobium sp. EP60837]ANI79349.1 3-oxoacyl-[acyl-carrier-protein] reductase [Sphingobium sp. EP60837]